MYGKTVPCRQKSGSKSFKADYGYCLPPFSYRAGPALPHKRKILIISLQSQPTLVGGANKAEAQVVVPVRRSVVVPVANRRVVGVVVPGTIPRVLFTKLGKLCVFDTVRTRRRAESCRFCRKIPFFLTFFCRKNATAKPLALPLLRLHGLRLLSAPI